MNENYKFDYRLGTIAQTQNWRTASGAIVAYEPYIREMRVWAHLFKQVDIFAPLSTGEIRMTVSEYGFPNIDFELVSYSHSTRWWGAFVRFVQLPVVLLKLFLFVWKHEVLLIRSPSHLGLFAHIFVFSAWKEKHHQICWLFFLF